jgi:hypothetical protein
LWIPKETKQLIDFISEWCGPALQLMLAEALTQSLLQAPIEQVGRELLDIVTGRKPSRSPMERAIVISAVTETSANPLPLSARALLGLRYREALIFDPYLTTIGGTLHPVWLEIREDLPTELVQLLPEDESGL